MKTKDRKGSKNFEDQREGFRKRKTIEAKKMHMTVEPSGKTSRLTPLSSKMIRGMNRIKKTNDYMARRRAQEIVKSYKKGKR